MGSTPDDARTDRAATPARAPAQDDHAAEKLAQYHHTILEFCDGGPRIDLRRPVDAAVRQVLAERGLGAGFAVLTAENPGGENDEDAALTAERRALARENEQRTSLLVEELERTGLPFVRLDGMAPDGHYRERCVAVEVGDPAAGVALARRWTQLALFWFDGEAFWLLPAEVKAPPERLP